MHPFICMQQADTGSVNLQPGSQELRKKKSNLVTLILCSFFFLFICLTSHSQSSSLVVASYPCDRHLNFYLSIAPLLSLMLKACSCSPHLKVDTILINMMVYIFVLDTTRN